MLPYIVIYLLTNPFSLNTSLINLSHQKHTVILSYRACRRSIISLNSVSRCDHQFFPCVECSKIDLQPQQRSTGITSELVTMSKIPPSELPPHSANWSGRRLKELDPNDPSDNVFLMVSLQFIVVNIFFFSKKIEVHCSPLTALSHVRCRLLSTMFHQRMPGE